jgi:hypothetical protein
MATFRFYQDTEIKAWIRDFFEIEADSLEDAINLIKKGNTTLDELENQTKQVTWSYRDYDLVNATMIEQGSYGIYSCDLEMECEESEILAK